MKKLSLCVLAVSLFATGAHPAVLPPGSVIPSGPFRDFPAIPGPGGNVFNAVTGSDSDYFAANNSVSDNLWSTAGGAALLSHTVSNEDSPRLKQTITGLDPSKPYPIYIKGKFFWRENDPSLAVKTAYYAPAGNLEGDPLITYLNDDGLAPTAGVNEVYFFVGTVSGVSSATVEYDDFDITAVDAFTGSPKRANRTLIDGLAIRIPEPSTMAVFAAAGVGLLTSRQWCCSQSSRHNIRSA